MADIRESFPVLENATGEGTSLRAMQQGDTPTLKNGLIGFSFKDSSGNVVLPTLNADGTLPVSSGAAGTAKLQRAEHAGSLIAVDVATMTLTASKVHSEISFNASCFRETRFQLIWKNDATETVLDDVLVGPGHFTHTVSLGDYSFTSGATGTQSLILRGENLEKASTMRGRIGATEVA